VCWVELESYEKSISCSIEGDLVGFQASNSEGAHIIVLDIDAVKAARRMRIEWSLVMSIFSLALLARGCVLVEK